MSVLVVLEVLLKVSRENDSSYFPCRNTLHEDLKNYFGNRKNDLENSYDIFAAAKT